MMFYLLSLIKVQPILRPSELNGKIFLLEDFLGADFEKSQKLRLISVTFITIYCLTPTHMSLSTFLKSYFLLSKKSIKPRKSEDSFDLEQTGGWSELLHKWVLYNIHCKQKLSTLTLHFWYLACVGRQRVHMCLIFNLQGRF